jgi:hypothetical protein
MGSTSVLATLNLLPEAEHQSARIASSSENLSLSESYVVVSSANRVAMSFSLLTSRIPVASDSIVRSNSRHDNGSPCQTPQYTLKGALSTPLIMTLVDSHL